MALALCYIAGMPQLTPCEHETCKLSNAEVNELAHHLAYQSCETLFDGECGSADDVDGEPGVWYDTDVRFELAADGVAEAVKYLDARGLIVRHPKKPNWISLHDESEATR